MPTAAMAAAAWSCVEKMLQRDPADVGTERFQRLDQHGGLDGHVQGAGNPRALQRLGRAIFGADGHQARHFGFSEFDFLAAKSGEANVLDDIIVLHREFPVWVAERRDSRRGQARQARLSVAAP